MKKARGSEWDTVGIFTALQNSKLVALAAGADLHWD
jgi:hypothetical protein